MARLKIATFNINGIRARHGALLEWLERESPDIACLQELKAADDAFPLHDIERLGYGALWHGQKSWNGVAILARGAPPELRRKGLPGDPDPSQSRYLEADVHGLRVACLYLPNGNPWPGPKFEYKLAWFAALQRHAKSLLADGAPTVMCGDFNVVPTDDLDIYNPASWRKDALLQPESRAAWFDLVAQGWTDAIRAVHGEAKVFTFWDYFRKHWERDAGLRIDHLLLSPSLAPALADAGVDRWVRGREGASDHAPTWVALEPAGPGEVRAAVKKARATKAVAKKPGAQKAPSRNAAAKKGAAKKVVARKVARSTVHAERPVARKTAANPVAATKVAGRKAVSNAPGSRHVPAKTAGRVAKRVR